MELQPALKPSYTLVLTASISPSPGAKVKRSDIAVRRQDYLNAFNFWLQLPDPRINRILFLENSGDDLKAFRQLVATSNPHQKSVEFVSVPAIEIPEGIHYGMGELSMIDDGLAQSRTIRETTHLIKATGRYTFPALPRLLNRLPSNFDVLAECRIPTRAYRKGLSLIPAILQRREAYAATHLIIFRTAVYEQYFRGLYRTMEPRTLHGIVEHLVYDRLRDVAGDLRVLWRFPVNCEPIGIGAANNANYRSASKKVTSLLRGLLRGTPIWI